MIVAWRWLALGGFVTAAVYLAGFWPAAAGVCALAVSIGTIWACFAGPRRVGAEPRAAWRLLGVGTAFPMIGLMIRPAVTAAGVPLLADAASVAGFIFLSVFLGMLLRARHTLERHSLLDGLIVCLSAGLAVMLLLAVPAAESPAWANTTSAMSWLFPLLDVVILQLVVNLTFTARSWPVSLGTLLAGITLMLSGDLGYAINSARGDLGDLPILDALYLMSYTLIGVTALHPSAARLGAADRQPVQAWSWRRMTLLGPALVAPFALLLVVGDTPGRRTAIAIVGGIIVGLLLLRAVSAVSAQASAQRHAEYQASHDPLTGLPNRRLISLEIGRLLRSLPVAEQDGPCVWLFLLDLDSFKNVNDSWGHETGDRVVIEAGARLRAALPEGVPVAALGADEFILAYAGARDDAMHVVDTIRGCFAQPFVVGDVELRMTTSIGISQAGRNGDAQALMRDADTALYQAKSGGPGNATVFDPSMHDRVRERIELEVALRQALTDRQLRVFYQPLVNLKTGRPLGAESLVRWTHPERGPISPAVFIPVAEDAGLIGELGTWVRREALRQLAEWRTAGVVSDDFYLSINVSAKQLTEHEFPLVVAGELHRFGVPARCVALEMTESIMMDSSGNASARALFELRELGVKLLIDDFGTGFSGLGYLRKFPMTGVKIDRSFVVGLGADKEADELVRAIVAMSQALGLAVIAEGVETRVQRDTLADIGVTNGQGWLWGPAVPPGEFAEAWHTAGKAATLH